MVFTYWWTPSRTKSPFSFRLHQHYQVSNFWSLRACFSPVLEPLSMSYYSRFIPKNKSTSTSTWKESSFRWLSASGVQQLWPGFKQNVNYREEKVGLVQVCRLWFIYLNDQRLQVWSTFSTNLPSLNRTKNGTCKHTLKTIGRPRISRFSHLLLFEMQSALHRVQNAQSMPENNCSKIKTWTFFSPALWIRCWNIWKRKLWETITCKIVERFGLAKCTYYSLNQNQDPISRSRRNLFLMSNKLTIFSTKSNLKLKRF